jgi:hypothetical protein
MFEELSLKPLLIDCLADIHLPISLSDINVEEHVTRWGVCSD